MIAVAVVAIVSTAGIMLRRSRDFAKQAALHAAEEERRRFLLWALAPKFEESFERERKDLVRLAYVRNPIRNPDLREQATQSHQDANENRAMMNVLERQRDYHAQLKQQYQRAVTHPWEQVPLDPPNLPIHRSGLPCLRAYGPSVIRRAVSLTLERGSEFAAVTQ
jgi:hypothetical protein